MASIAVLLLVGCGIEFNTLSLEDNVPVPEPIVGLGDFAATKVFGNSSAEVWGLEKDECQDVKSTSVAYEGNSAIEVNWDRGGCEWAGFGIGWNGWSSKDLSDIMHTGAFEFYIRSVEGETSIPLMIFLLEDYGGTMCAAVFGSASLESYPINETWQKAQVPLSWFNNEEEGCDVSNIKQLVIELQNSGSVIIDEMKIVEYTPSERPADSRIAKKSEIPFTGEAVVFDEAFGNVWGLGTYGCRNYEITQEEAFMGKNSLAMTFKKGDGKCEWKRFGTSWTEWIAVDMKTLAPEFECWIKSDAALDDQDLYVGLQDYNYHELKVQITEDHVVREERGWKLVQVPFFDAGFGTEKLPGDRIKELFLEGNGTGTIYLDELKISALQ